VNDGEQSDRAWGGSRSEARRRLQRLELTPVVAVQDVPSTLAQALADGVSFREALLSPEASSLGG
jgi:hypothetical protein